MTHPVDLYVGARLRQRRMSMGVTLRELSDQLGVTYQVLQKYESGEIRICASRLWELAAALECQPSEFFEGLRGCAPDIPALPCGRRSDQEATQLVRNFHSIPAAQRSQILALACALRPA